MGGIPGGVLPSQAPAISLFLVGAQAVLGTETHLTSFRYERAEGEAAAVSFVRF